MTTLAVMQPYFVPYAGYFRLFAAADVLVLYDCVQFPRRGYVHRNRLHAHSGDLQWLTLPLRRSPRTTLIADLQFAADWQEKLRSRMRAFPTLANYARGKLPDHPVVHALFTRAPDPVTYIELLLKAICRFLGLCRPIVRSSTLGIPTELRCQDRVLSIAQRVGAQSYVNAPGGRHLYNRREFLDRGVELNFLDEFTGSISSMLERCLTESAHKLRSEITSQSSVSQTSGAAA